MSGALLRFQIMAFITGVLLAVMTVIGLPYKYLLDGTAAWYSLGWMAHGWLYIAYVIVSLDLVFRMKWHLGRALLIILAGIKPPARCGTCSHHPRLLPCGRCID